MNRLELAIAARYLRSRRGSRLLSLISIIAIGGEGTLAAANRLANDGINVMGVPKTIDNDLHGTEFTFGFHTAVQIATDAIDRLHTTAESHDRVMVVEVMGRHVGWIATYAGLAGGATAILIPEREFDLREVAQHRLSGADHGGEGDVVVGVHVAPLDVRAVVADVAPVAGGEAQATAAARPSIEPARPYEELAAENVALRAQLEGAMTVPRTPTPAPPRRRSR